MNRKRRSLFRILSLVLCFAAFISCLSAYAENSNDGREIKVIFAGNSKTPNMAIKSYSSITAEYLEKRLGTKVSFADMPPLDIDEDDFLDKLEENIISESPDIFFWEINLSKKNKGSKGEIKKRISAVVEKLETERKTAVYFVYVPDESFADWREPYDEVAGHYGIRVINAFDRFKKSYENGSLETNGFLTAGKIIGEGGHALLGKYICSFLEGAGDIALAPDMSKKPLAEHSEFERKKGAEPEKTENEKAVFYVAKGGDDRNSGTIDFPFATLNGAKLAVRRMKNELGKAFSGATVYLREGSYKTEEPFTLTAEDSGEEGAEIVYSAYPGEKVRLTNASVLEPSKWKKVTDAEMLSRIPENARDKVLVYDLAGDNISPGFYRQPGLQICSGAYGRNYPIGAVLVANGKTEPRAAYPNGGYSKIPDTQTESKNELYYSDNVGDRWKTAENAWIKGILKNGYYTDYVRVKGFDFEKKIIYLGANTAYGQGADRDWSIFNLIEELDMASEWYVDEKTSMLYYYPRGDIKDEEILFSSTVSPIIRLSEAKYIKISSLELVATCGSAVEISDGYSNTVENCEIGNTGYRGVNIAHTVNKPNVGKNGVVGCHIFNTAISGVTVSGGDRKNLAPSEDYVENCHLENFAYEMHSETGGLETLNTVGVTFKNNVIHNDDSCALWMGGNDDYFAYNEIYNIGRETDDYGVVYGSAAGGIHQGVTMTHNYIHDCEYSGLYAGGYGQLSGFYSDALRNNGAKVDNNVWVNMCNPIFFADNQNMTARGNLIIDASSWAIRGYYTHADAAKLDSIHKQLKDEAADGSIWKKYTQESQMPDKLVWRALIDSGRSISAEEWKNYYLKYPWLEHYLEKGPLVQRDIVVTDNAVYNAAKNISFPQQAAATISNSGNYVTDKTVPMPDGGTAYDRIDLAMEDAAGKNSNFESWDVRTAGTDKTDYEVGEFSALYPANNQSGVTLSGITLRWDFASGADEYYVKVATDSEFKNVIYEAKTTAEYVKPQNLKYGAHKYYWKVKASSFSERFKGSPENSNGVMCFTTLKSAKVDKTNLEKKMKEAQDILETVEDGSKPGEYKEGTKKALEDAIAAASTVCENIRSTNETIEKTLNDLDSEIFAVRSRQNLSEINFADLFNSPESIFISEAGKTAEPGVNEDGTLKAGLEKTADGILYKAKGGAFASRDVEPYEILRFKAKYDFSGVATASNYSMFGIRAQSYSNVLHNVANYAFLVTKDNIELQAFKPTGGGKLYFTVPNTYIKEGEEYNIEFGVVPVDEGRNTRILLVINGEVVYDKTDTFNQITKGGKAGFVNSAPTSGMTIMQPDENLPYPSLLERLENPEDGLYKK